MKYSRAVHNFRPVNLSKGGLLRVITYIAGRERVNLGAANLVSWPENVQVQRATAMHNCTHNLNAPAPLFRIA